MNILGIDYGRKKIGLALASSKLAMPLTIVKFVSWPKLVQRLTEIASREKVTKIIIGLSEAKMAEETKSFGEKLKKEISLPIEYFDETLSTYEAQRLAKEAGMKRKKRISLEDAFAAAVMLQFYLDANV